MEPRLGIAITTFNRRDLVISLCAAIRLFTTSPYDLVVCDDGSTDGTVETLKSLGETVIGGRNGGIARNKNRGIWYLLTRTRSDFVCVLEDDVLPTRTGWEAEWIEGAKTFGHVNYAAPFAVRDVVAGSRTAADPGISTHLTGQVMAFRRDAIASVGFMDPRFGRYGHEHADLTCRAIRAGFGGHQVDDGMRFLVIDGAIRVIPTPSTGSRADIDESAAVWGRIAHEQIYRHAWRDDAERAEFLSETIPL